MDNFPAKVTERPAIHDVWKLPFHADDYGVYIWSENGQMVFTFTTRQPDGIRQRIVDILNGDKKASGAFTFRLKKAVHVIAKSTHTGEEIPIGLVRGWGYLHGVGGLNLDVEVAEKVHEELCEWIVARLNGQV